MTPRRSKGFKEELKKNHNHSEHITGHFFSHHNKAVTGVLCYRGVGKLTGQRLQEGSVGSRRNSGRKSNRRKSKWYVSPLAQDGNSWVEEGGEDTWEMPTFCSILQGI